MVKQQLHSQALSNATRRMRALNAQKHADVVGANKYAAFQRRSEGTLRDILLSQNASPILKVPEAVTAEAFLRAASTVWVMKSKDHSAGYTPHKILALYHKGRIEGGFRIMGEAHKTAHKPYRKGDFMYFPGLLSLSDVFSYVPNNARAKRSFAASEKVGDWNVFFTGHQEKTTTAEYIRNLVHTHISDQHDFIPGIIPLYATIPLPPPDDNEIAYLKSGGEINPGPPSGAAARRAKATRDDKHRQRDKGKESITEGASTSGGPFPPALGTDGTDRGSRNRLPLKPDLGRKKLSIIPPKKVCSKAHDRLIDVAVRMQEEEAHDKAAGAADAKAEEDKEERDAATLVQDATVQALVFKDLIITVPNLSLKSYHFCSCTTGLQSTLGLEARAPHTELECQFVSVELTRHEDDKIDIRNPGLLKYKPHDKCTKYIHYNVNVRSYGFFFDDGSDADHEDVTIPVDFLYLCKRRRVHTAGDFYAVYLLVSALAKEYVPDYNPFAPELSVNLFHRDLLIAALCTCETRPCNMSLPNLFTTLAKESIDSGFFKNWVKDHPAAGGTYMEGYTTAASSVFKATSTIPEQLAKDAGLLKVKTLSATRAAKKRMAQWRLYPNNISIPSAPALTQHNNFLGMCKRLLSKTPEPTQEMQEVGNAIVSELIASEDGVEMGAPSDEEVEEASQAYPMDQRAEWKSGATLVCTVMQQGNEDGPQATELSDLLELPVGTFTKAESYVQGENKAPRMIVAPLMKVRGVLWAMYSKPAKRVTAALHEFNVKGLTMGKIASEMSAKFSEVTSMVKTDHTSFESTITGFRRSLETKFLSVRHYAVLEPYYKKMETLFTIKNEYFEILSDSIRRSGEYFTSSGNCLQNFIFWVQSLAKSLNPQHPVEEARRLIRTRLDGLSALFEGDDGLCQIPDHLTSDILNSAAYQAGARLKLEVVHDFEDVSFCKIQFSGLSLLNNAPMRFAFKDPVAIIAKLGTNMSPDLDSLNFDSARQYAAAVSHLTEFPRHPMSSAYARGIIKCAKNRELTKRVYAATSAQSDDPALFAATHDIRARTGKPFKTLMQEWQVTLNLLDSSVDAFIPTDEHYAAVERVYGYAMSTMKAFEMPIFAYAAGMVTTKPDLSALELPHNMIKRVFPDARVLARELGSGFALGMTKVMEYGRNNWPVLKGLAYSFSVAAGAYAALCLFNPLFWFVALMILGAVSLFSGLVAYGMGASSRRVALFAIAPTTLILMGAFSIPIALLVRWVSGLKSTLSQVRAAEHSKILSAISYFL